MYLPGIHKKIVAAGENCGVVTEWAQGISNHMYWCAASGKAMERNWKPSGCRLRTTLLMSTKDMVTDSQNANMVPLRTGNGWRKVTNIAVYYMAHRSVHKMAHSDWLVTAPYFRVRTCEMDLVRWTARNIAHATLCLDFVNLLLWSFLMSDDSEHSESEFYYPNETDQVPQKESDQEFLANWENVDSLAKFRSFMDEQQAPSAKDKTKIDLNVWSRFCQDKNEMRELEDIP